MEEQLKCCSSERTTYVTGSNPHDDNKVFYSPVIIYWTLNSVYMQFEWQYPKSSTVSVEHVKLSRGMYCLK